MRLPARRPFVLAALLSGVALTSAAQAATYTWTGSAGTTIWGTANNWQPNAAPANNGTADVVFGPNGAPQSNLETGYSIQSLTFAAGGPSFTLGGSTLLIGAGGLRQGSTAAQNFFSPVSVNTTETWNLAGGAGALNFNAGVDTTGAQLGFNVLPGLAAGAAVNGVFSGGGLLGLSGGGTLVLNGANTYTGGTVLGYGLLGVGNDAALGTGAVQTTGGTTLFAAGTDHALANNFSVLGNLTLYVGLSSDGGHDLTLNGQIAGTGSLMITTPGHTVTLGGSTSNTLTGLTSVSAGTLALSKANGDVAIAGDLSIGNAGAAPVAGSVPVATVRLLNVINQNLFSANTNVTVYADGLLDLNVSTVTIHNLTMTGGEILLGGNGILLNGDVTINASATGSQIISRNNYASVTTPDDGTHTFTVADGAATYDLDVQAPVGFGRLVKTGPGTLRLADTVLLAVTLNAGTLAAGSNDALGNGVGPFTLAGGTLVADGGDRTVTTAVDVTGKATVGSSVDGTPRAFTFNSPMTLESGATLTVSNNAATTFAGSVGGAGGIVKNGNGTLTLGYAANTFTGGLTLNGGTLSAAGDGSLGGAGSVVTLNAGTLQFTASTMTARTFILSNGVTLGAAAGTTLTFASGAAVNGGFLGAGGTLAFADGSALNGSTTAQGGTVTTAGAVAFNNATLRGGTTVGAGSTLSASNLLLVSAGVTTVNGTVNSTGLENDGVLNIAGGGAVNNGGVPLTLGGGSRTTVAAGGTLTAAAGTSIELNGALLTNNGTQNGNLNVNYGSQAQGGGFFGNVTVGQGGQFGNNAVGGGTNMAAFNAGGPLFGAASTAPASPAVAVVGPQPSTTPQTVNVANLDLKAGSTLNFNLQNTQLPAGQGYDLTDVGNQLTLEGNHAAGGQIVLRLTGLDGNGNQGSVASFDPSQNYRFTFVQTGGGITGYVPGEFAINTAGFANSLQGGSFSVVQQGNNLVLVFTTAVPEPATWALLVVGIAGLGLAAVRRRAGRTGC